MKKMLCLIGLAMIGVFGVVALTAGDASATTICYVLGGFSSERLVLSVTPQGPLTGTGQKTFRVHGKHVSTCGGGTAVPVYGTVNTATKGTVTGDHMGLRTNTARASCTALTWECTSASTSATPATWSCHFKPDGGALSSLLSLTAVSPPDATCAVFEDGATAPAILDSEPESASATGLSE